MKEGPPKFNHRQCWGLNPGPSRCSHRLYYLCQPHTHLSNTYYYENFNTGQQSLKHDGHKLSGSVELNFYYTSNLRKTANQHYSSELDTSLPGPCLLGSLSKTSRCLVGSEALSSFHQSTILDLLKTRPTIYTLKLFIGSILLLAGDKFKPWPF